MDRGYARVVRTGHIEAEWPDDDEQGHDPGRQREPDPAEVA